MLYATTNAPPAPAAPLPSGEPSLACLVASMHDVAARIDRGDADATAALGALTRRLRGHADPRATGLVTFAAAMGERLDEAAIAETNLYLRRFEVPQIELFGLLGRHVPMARMSTRVANDALALALAGVARPTLVDVGVGAGRQLAALLGDLARRGALPAALTVIGIEPAEAALAQARDGLTALAGELGCAVDFHGFASTAEGLRDEDWARVAALCTAPPAINAAFALHHVADDAGGRDQRDAVLRRLRALAPSSLVLSEPDVDHREPRFLPRFRNCFAHFSALFGVLDALPIAQAERDALKVGFFGREIADVLGAPEARRSERHEPAASWARRLAGAGFVAGPVDVALPASGHPLVSSAWRAGHVAIAAGGEPLVAIFAARPVA